MGLTYLAAFFFVIFGTAQASELKCRDLLSSELAEAGLGHPGKSYPEVNKVISEDRQVYSNKNAKVIYSVHEKTQAAGSDEYAEKIETLTKQFRKNVYLNAECKIISFDLQKGGGPVLRMDSVKCSRVNQWKAGTGASAFNSEILSAAQKNCTALQSQFQRQSSGRPSWNPPPERADDAI